jgi:3-hydroxybutyryl-CoA dehydrogenase
MPLVEVISGEETEEGLADEVAGLLRSVGKISVTCRDIPGFIGNRLFHAVLREAAHLVQSGLCTAEEVDTVARLTFALRMPAVGPCENMDLVGLPLIADVQSYLLEDLSSEQNVLSGIAQRISEGNWGMRSGRGFYDWNTKDPLALVEARDRQIIRQLRTIQDIGRLPIP